MICGLESIVANCYQSVHFARDSSEMDSVWLSETKEEKTVTVTDDSDGKGDVEEAVADHHISGSPDGNSCLSGGTHIPRGDQ